MSLFFLWFSLTASAAPCGPGDSDGDSVLDVDEDTEIPDGDCANDHSDQDGIPNYLDPDDDGDGVPTTDEVSVGANPYAIDSDHDFVFDSDEWPRGDTDGDGDADIMDTDDDGDGISTVAEFLVAQQDPDGDGIPNWLDLDSDDDTYPDAVEGDGDVDSDGIPNWVDTEDVCAVPVDKDLDGAWDRVEVEHGSEPQDPDSDGDQVDDGTELSFPWTLDTDGDGLLDVLDTDDDGDGVPTEDELGPECPDGGPVLFTVLTGPVTGCRLEYSCTDGTVLASRAFRDTDLDGVRDYVDTDDDGDGIPTAEEHGQDADCDQLEDHLDPDLTDGPCSESPTDSGTTDPNTETTPTAGPKHLDAGTTGCGCQVDRAETTVFGGTLLAMLALARRHRKR